MADLAERQHGPASIEQLLATGVSASAVRRQVARGQLHPIHRGVYAVGHADLSREGYFMAAVLACGPGAVLSHRSAAAHLGIRPTAATQIDVSSPTRAGRARGGIRAHRAANLAPEDIVDVDAIPTTSVARTLLDLAEVIDHASLAKAIDQAEILRIFDLRALEDVIARNPGRHGLRSLRALLSSLEALPTHTRNDLEARFLVLCMDSGLPRPKANDWLSVEGNWIEADFHWPEHRLVAETDGFETHRTRQAFERDRLRDQLLLRAHYHAVRFTWRQLLDDPAWVAETVRRGLALAAA